MRDGGQVEGLVESVWLLGEKVKAVEMARQVEGRAGRHSTADCYIFIPGSAVIALRSCSSDCSTLHCTVGECSAILAFSKVTIFSLRKAMLVVV